jgi:alpha-tubulin suppressor-like RCC1 family protein
LKGQLGNGTTADSSLYGGVSGLSSGVSQVSAGGDHALALTCAGTVWAWGNGAVGELGNGFTQSSDTPVQVEELTAITQIAAGAAFNLTLRSDGTVWAWGYNETGALGDGTWANSDVPVQVSGLSQVTAIAAGELAAMAVARRGFIAPITSVWTWGYNASGQLGDGTFTSRDLPAQVSGIGVPGGAGVAGIAGGYDFSMVLGSDGSVWAWGNNHYGELNGYPTATDQPTPTEVYGMGSGITQISAGEQTLALRSDGTVLAWGSNFGGDLGNGTSATTKGIVQVSGLTSATQVPRAGTSAWPSS